MSSSCASCAHELTLDLDLGRHILGLILGVADAHLWVGGRHGRCGQRAEYGVESSKEGQTPPPPPPFMERQAAAPCAQPASQPASHSASQGSCPAPAVGWHCSRVCGIRTRPRLLPRAFLPNPSGRPCAPVPRRDALQAAALQRCRCMVVPPPPGCRLSGIYHQLSHRQLLSSRHPPARSLADTPCSPGRGSAPAPGCGRWRTPAGTPASKAGRQAGRGGERVRHPPSRHGGAALRCASLPPRSASPLRSAASLLLSCHSCAAIAAAVTRRAAKPAGARRARPGPARRALLCSRRPSCLNAV